MSTAPLLDDCPVEPMSCDGCPACYAMSYAEKGWRVVPIMPATKRPPLKAWTDKATTDPEMIRKWWDETYKGHGVGIVTGQGSGLFVLDVDVSDGKQGRESLAALDDKYGKLPPTARVVTGSGGWHLYYRLPAGCSIRNDAGKRLGAGLDIRGEGGQVVAPPTVHPGTGALYEWDKSAPAEPAEAPTWLLELLEDSPADEPAEEDEPPALSPFRQPPSKRPTPRGPRRPTPPDGDGGEPVPIPLAAETDSPVEWYNDHRTWEELLEADGWTAGGTDSDGRRHWTRPGKDAKDGESANVKGEALYVHTTSLEWLPAGKSYSRFGYYAARHHNGDGGAAARTIRREMMPASGQGPVRSDHLGADGEWLEPMPLVAGDQLPAFPTDALPEPIRSYVEHGAKSMGTDPDLLGTLTLPALATLVGGRWRVKVKDAWQEEATLYVAAVGRPGTMKSQAMRLALGCLPDLEADLIESKREEIAKAQSARRKDEARLRQMEAAAAKTEESTEDRGTREQLAECLAKPEPVEPSLYATDATAEAIERKMAENGGRTAWLSAEGGLFGAAAGRYKANGASANLDVFLSGYSGDALKVQRMGRPTVNVPRAALTIGVAVQPQALTAASKNSELTGRGLLDRFLVAWPTLSPAKQWEPRPEIPSDVRKRYERMQRGIFQRSGVQDSPAEPHTIELGAEAVEALNQWMEARYPEIVQGGRLEHLGGWNSKLAGTTARMAALFELAGDPHAITVGLEAMSGALKMADYFTDHALRAFGEMGMREDVRGAGECLAAIRAARPTPKRWGEWPERITARDVHTAVRNREGLATSQEVKAALSILEDHGYLRRLEEPTTGGKVLYEVNPQIFERNGGAEGGATR